MTLTQIVTKNVIKKLLNGEDYRIEIVNLINASFLQYSIDFFKKVIEAKLKSESITHDWYKKEFINSNLSSEEIAINSGLNKKTIMNMHNSATKEIVLDAAIEHYDGLYEAIKELVDSDDSIDIKLTLKFGGVSVDLTVSETLIVINTLAVKRAQIVGGFWSTAGKRVEKPLMVTICKLFGVTEEFYKIKQVNTNIEMSEEDFVREIDFYLIDPDKKEYKCEVKLMGRGNPESADAVIARDSAIFIGDKLSDTNKKQLNSRGVLWVELRSDIGYRRIEEVLKALEIPYIRPQEKIEGSVIDSILSEAVN